ncbi:TPA: Fe-S-binding ATPase, partial [Morganella morganii]|nr:Fe-S-binding ATPase [Morganella morganii]
MNAKSPGEMNPELLNDQVAQVLATFEHPTLKRNLIAIKALNHCAMLDDVLHVELVMPFVWKRPFEALIEAKTKELRKVTGAAAV